MAATSPARSAGKTAGKTVKSGGYTLVIAQGSDGYVAPYQVDAPSGERYMVVRRVHGGAWGVVDRRRGRLVEGASADQHIYTSWAEAQDAVRLLNEQQ